MPAHFNVLPGNSPFLGWTLISIKCWSRLRKFWLELGEHLSLTQILHASWFMLLPFIFYSWSVTAYQIRSFYYIHYCHYLISDNFISISAITFTFENVQWFSGCKCKVKRKDTSRMDLSAFFFSNDNEGKIFPTSYKDIQLRKVVNWMVLLNLLTVFCGSSCTRSVVFNMELVRHPLSDEKQINNKGWV